MDVLNLGKARHFLQAKAVSLGVVDRPHMVCELLCLTPGQREDRRTQSNCDELFLVVEGHASLMVGSVLHELEALDLVVAPPGVERWLSNEDEAPLTVLAIMAPNPKHVSIRPANRLPPRRMPLRGDSEDQEGSGEDESHGGEGLVVADEGRPLRTPRLPARRGSVRGSVERPHFEDNEGDERNSIPDERPRRPQGADRPHGAAGRFANTRAPRFGGGDRARDGSGGPVGPARGGPPRAGRPPMGGRPAGGTSRGSRPMRDPLTDETAAFRRPAGPARGRGGAAGPSRAGGTFRGGPREGFARSGPGRPPAGGAPGRFRPARADGDAGPPRPRGAGSRPAGGGSGRPRSGPGGPGGASGARPRQSGRPGPGRSGPRP